MNAETIQQLTTATLTGSMPFPEIVGRLIEEGVDYYHVDFRALHFRFYGRDGGVVIAPLVSEGLPEVAEAFDAPGLRAAIGDNLPKEGNIITGTWTVENGRVLITRSPKDILVFVAGDESPYHSCYFCGWGLSRAASRRVES